MKNEIFGQEQEELGEQVWKHLLGKKEETQKEMNENSRKIMSKFLEGLK